jgi:hypothetical protein
VVDRVVGVAVDVGRRALGLRATGPVGRAAHDLMRIFCQCGPQLPVDACVWAADWTEASRCPRSEVDADEHLRDAFPAPRDPAYRSLASGKTGFTFGRCRGNAASRPTTNARRIREARTVLARWRLSHLTASHAGVLGASRGVAGFRFSRWGGEPSRLRL